MGVTGWLALLAEHFGDEGDGAEDVEQNKHKAMYRQQGCLLLTVQRYAQVVQRACTILPVYAFL